MLTSVGHTNKPVDIHNYMRPPYSLLQSQQHLISPQVATQCAVMQLGKYSFAKPVVQALQNHSSPGSRSGALSPMQEEVPIIALGMHNQRGKLKVKVL